MPSVTVSIVPHVGVRKVDGVDVEADLGIDAIMLSGPEWPTPKRVGFIGRDPGSVPSITTSLSQSDMAAVVAAVTARGGASQVSQVEALPGSTPKR